MITYRMLYLNWHPLITVRNDEDEIIIRVLMDDKGELYPKDKPIRYDVVINGVTGPDASSLKQLLEIFERNIGLKKFLPLFRKALEELYFLEVV
jgi:hypothetical protein